ncbi:MAG: alpha/beta fold hydrolase [Bacteroidales bacterium]|nr:alpha/beta fold hydrolase [Bacteroidales bacterium]
MYKRSIITAVMISVMSMIANAQTGTWSGKLDVQGTKLSLVFHLDGENPSMDSPDQGAEGIPIQVSRPASNTIKVIIPSLGASYEGVWMIRQIVGTFTQMNASFPLTLTPGENKPARPQTPKPPYPYQTEEVSFTNGDIVLNGTLTLPTGCSRETPMLVMVTGSGIQNRDEELFEHKPFAVIADALARAGYATLRYDDRGFGSTGGNPLAWTTSDFKSDAEVAVDLLRNRFDRVGVIGHSEGGTIALMLAAEKKADFIVSLAGMVVSGAETLVSQNRSALLLAGVPEEVTEEYCRLLEQAFDVQVNGGMMTDPDDYNLPKELKQNYQAVLNQVRTPYLSKLLTLDVRPLLADITCPVLALNGTKDIQVDHESNLDALRNGLKASDANHIEAIEGANHLLQNCMTGAVTEYRTIEETISPKVLETVIAWLSAL